jgi:Protein of unknown function (DUF3592)
MQGRVDGFPLNFDTILALLLVIGATVLLLRSIWHLLTGLESRSWPTTQGIVMASKLQEDREADGDRFFRASVSYRFTVGGCEFVGNRACFGDSDLTSWSWAARKIVNRYRPGDAVTVHYDPSKPREAVLEPGVSGTIMATLAFEIAFLAFAILALGGTVDG